MDLWFFMTLVKGPNRSNDSWEPLDKGRKQFGFFFQELPNSGIFYVLVEQNNLVEYFLPCLDQKSHWVNTGSNRLLSACSTNVKIHCQPNKQVKVMQVLIGLSRMIASLMWLCVLSSISSILVHTLGTYRCQLNWKVVDTSYNQKLKLSRTLKT